jgi:DNA modification methylase
VAELVWKGKRRRPFGRPESSAQPPWLRADEAYGVGERPNRLIAGDRLEVLSSLQAELEGKVALVYVDPPFSTGKDYETSLSFPGANGGRVALRAYRDRQTLDAWLAWFFDTAVALRQLMAAGGSLYAHLDAHVAHYAKVVLDEVFGREGFQREIIWRIGWVSGFKSRARSWVRNHDTLLFYSNGRRPTTFHKQYVPYRPGYRRRDGSPPRTAGYPIDDVWNGNGLDPLDSIQIKSFSVEKVGYPTQKNESLLARIIRASSAPEDLVLDCFGGSGTTAVVSEQLGRKWVVSDVSPLAIHTMRRRLLRLRDVGPFVVESVHRKNDSASLAHRTGGRLRLRASCRVRTGTIKLVAFRPKRAGTSPSSSGVEHWSHWVDIWCVEWNHLGATFHADTIIRRDAQDLPLCLEAVREYGRPGSYLAMVKIFDIFGETTTATVAIAIEE